MRLSLFPLLPSTAALSATFSVQAYQRGGLMLVLGAALADQVPFPLRRAPCPCACPPAYVRMPKKALETRSSTGALDHGARVCVCCASACRCPCGSMPACESVEVPVGYSQMRPLPRSASHYTQGAGHRVSRRWCRRGRGGALVHGNLRPHGAARVWQTHTLGVWHTHTLAWCACLPYSYSCFVHVLQAIARSCFPPRPLHRTCRRDCLPPPAAERRGRQAAGPRAHRAFRDVPL